jgi:hypothetical protein
LVLRIYSWNPFCKAGKPRIRIRIPNKNPDPGRINVCADPLACGSGSQYWFGCRIFIFTFEWNRKSTEILTFWAFLWTHEITLAKRLPFFRFVRSSSLPRYTLVISFYSEQFPECCSAAGAMRSLRETQLPTGTIGSPEETFVWSWFTSKNTGISQHLYAFVRDLFGCFIFFLQNFGLDIFRCPSGQTGD